MKPMTVRPRIILITDGFASRKNQLEGEDNNDVDAEVRASFIAMVSEMGYKTMICILQ